MKRITSQILNILFSFAKENQKKTALGRFVFLILLTVMVVSCGGRTGGNDGQTEVINSGKVIDVLSRDKDTLDMGIITEGTGVEYIFNMKNTDTAAIVILDVKTDCGCTAVSYDSRPVKPGEETTVKLVYDSKNQSGKQLKTISVLTTSSNRQKTLMLTAEVKK